MRVETGDGWTMYQGDCLEVLPTLEGGSIDLVLTDPPYGTTACKWDTVIPFAPMWDGIKHVIKRNAAVVLFASQPFTSALVMSNPKWFKYCWVWIKSRPFDIFNCKHKPLRKHEDVCVFSDGSVANRALNPMPYYPQGLVKVDRPWKRPRFYDTEHRTVRPSNKLERVLEFTSYPTSVLEVANPNNERLHPTQKPVALLEYLIRTYTNEGDTVLDFTMGSGSTGVACIQTGRRFIGIELDSGYFDIAVARLHKAEEARQPALLDMTGD